MYHYYIEKRGCQQFAGFQRPRNRFISEFETCFSANGFLLFGENRRADKLPATTIKAKTNHVIANIPSNPDALTVR